MVIENSWFEKCFYSQIKKKNGPGDKAFFLKDYPISRKMLTNDQNKGKKVKSRKKRRLKFGINVLKTFKIVNNLVA